MTNRSAGFFIWLTRARPLGPGSPPRYSASPRNATARMLALYQFPPHNILHRLRGPHRPGSTFRSWIKYTVCVLHIGWTPCARSLADLATPNWVELPEDRQRP